MIVGEADSVMEMPGTCEDPPEVEVQKRAVKGVDKTYQWGGAKVYHQRGHWPA